MSARRIAIGLLVVALGTGCDRGADGGDGGTDGGEAGQVKLPDEAIARDDTATFQAPGGLYQFEVPSDWTFEEIAGGVRASPSEDGTPLLIAEVAPLGDADLDEWVAGQTAQSEVPIEVEQVDVPGATQARLIRQELEGGGRRTLVGVDEDEEFAVIVDLAWADGELTDDEVAEILGSVRLGEESQA